MAISLNPKPTQFPRADDPKPFQNMESPVAFAIRHGNQRLLERSIQAGFSPFKKDLQGRDALELAIENHRPTMVAILADRIFHIHSKEIAGRMDISKIDGELKSLQRVWHAYYSKIAQRDRLSPACRAAAANDLQMLKLYSPALLRAPDANGLTPFHYALFYGSKDTAAFLSKYANPAHITSDGCTYLHFAAMSGDPELVCLVKKLGTDIHRPNKNGWTPAHFFIAASSSLNDIVASFNKRSSFIAKSANGVSPLALLFAKAAPKPKPIVTGSDGLLALTSVVSAASFAYWSYFYRNTWLSPFDPKILLPAIAGLVSYATRQQIVSNMAPLRSEEDAMNAFVSPVGNCLAYAAGYGAARYWKNPAGFQIASLFIQAQTSAIIFNHCQSRLKTCIEQFRARPLAALGAASVHLLNAGIGLAAIVSSFAINYLTSKDPCLLPPGDYSKMSELEFLSRPEWKPDQCPNHAKQMLAGSNGTFDERQYQQNGEYYLKGLFNRLKWNLKLNIKPENFDLTNKSLTALCTAYQRQLQNC